MNSADRLQLQKLAQSFVQVMRNSGEQRNKQTFPRYKIYQHPAPQYDIIGFPIQGESYFLTRSSTKALLAYLGPTVNLRDVTFVKIPLPLSATHNKSSSELMSYAFTVIFDFQSKRMQLSISQTGLLHITDADVLYTNSARLRYG